MDYNKQAEEFLVSCNTIFQAQKATPQMSPRWAKDGKHGTQYSITLKKYDKLFTDEGKEIFHDWDRPLKEIQFFFWNSIHAKKEAEIRGHRNDRPKPYDVLAGLYTPCESFEDFCGNYGYSEDSREAEATYKEVVELNKKLESFFTSSELEGLQEIQ